LKRPEETAGPQAKPGKSFAAQIREKE